MEKRYQVFVSSTFLDLVEERQEVMQALLELDCMPSGMELFPATDDDQWSLIKKIIDDSDYYIVILAGRYGSLSPTGLSYTEMEYRYALDAGKPVLGFVHGDVKNLALKNSELGEEGRLKLESFRDLIQKKHCKFWRNGSELGSVVSRSLMKLIKTHPAEGWVKASLVMSDSTAKEILMLRHRIEELELELNSASVQEPKHAADLAKGNDVFPLTYNFHTDTDDCDFVEMEETSNISWDDLFSAVSPVLLGEASDKELKVALNNVAKFLAEEDFKDSPKLAGRSLLYFEVSDDDLHTILIQFRALGLITQGTKTRRTQNSDTYWTLTPYGDTVMTRLRAIHKILPTDD